MPLEIRELMIKVEIQEKGQALPAQSNTHFEALKSKLIEECMKKVLERMENYNSR